MKDSSFSCKRLINTQFSPIFFTRSIFKISSQEIERQPYQRTPVTFQWRLMNLYFKCPTIRRHTLPLSLELTALLIISQASTSVNRVQRSYLDSLGSRPENYQNFFHHAVFSKNTNQDSLLGYLILGEKNMALMVALIITHAFLHWHLRSKCPASTNDKDQYPKAFIFELFALVKIRLR